MIKVLNWYIKPVLSPPFHCYLKKTKPKDNLQTHEILVWLSLSETLIRAFSFNIFFLNFDYSGKNETEQILFLVQPVRKEG
jgi:hypothetical protein